MVVLHLHLMPGKTAEFTRQRQQRECIMCDTIGKQCTKDWNIDLNLEEIKSLEESPRSISPAEKDR